MAPSLPRLLRGSCHGATPLGPSGVTGLPEESGHPAIMVSQPVCSPEPSHADTINLHRRVEGKGGRRLRFSAGFVQQRPLRLSVPQPRPGGNPRKTPGYLCLLHSRCLHTANARPRLRGKPGAPRGAGTRLSPQVCAPWAPGPSSLRPWLLLAPIPQRQHTIPLRPRELRKGVHQSHAVSLPGPLRETNGAPVPKERPARVRLRPTDRQEGTSCP